MNLLYNYPPTHSKCFLILSSNRCLNFPTVIFLASFLNKKMIFPLSVHATWLTHLNLLRFSSLIINSKKSTIYVSLCHSLSPGSKHSLSWTSVFSADIGSNQVTHQVSNPDPVTLRGTCPARPRNALSCILCWLAAEPTTCEPAPPSAKPDLIQNVLTLWRLKLF
jgi:hypothetical protein